MKSRTLLVAGVALLVVALSVSPALAQEKPAPKSVTVVGTVSSTSGPDGKVTSAKLTLEDGTTVYTIVLDSVGEKLAKELSGKKVQVTGTLEKTDLKVSSYQEVKKKEEQAK